MRVNGVSPGFDPAGACAAAACCRGCTMRIEPRTSDVLDGAAASSTQTALPIPAPRLSSSDTTTAGPWSTPAREPAVVRYARTRTLSTTTRGRASRATCDGAIAAAMIRSQRMVGPPQAGHATSSRLYQPMGHSRLGSTGLRISRLGLGCGNFGGIGSAPAFFGMGETESQAFDLMDRAFDAGINFFDTANAYGGGRSETYIGRWLKAKGPAVRQQLLLSSKVFNPVGPGPNDRGLSRRHILQQVDESLARLQTDRLDMYLIHEPDPETPLEETLQALDDVVRAGKVLYVGASNIEAWRLARGLCISDKNRALPLHLVPHSFHPPAP